MKRAALLCVGLCFLVPRMASGNDGPSVWQSVQQAAFDPAKSVQVAGVTLERDSVQITLNAGVAQFTAPLNGIVYGAAFRGSGKIRVVAPNPLEGQQLKLHTGNEEVFEAEFSEAVFCMSDRTYEEIAAKSSPAGAADATLASLYREQQEFRESYGAEVLPRLVKAVLSKNRKETEYFYAEVKTEKGWIVARVDALNPEEVRLGRWTTFGIARISETWMSFPRAKRSPAQAWSNPTAREDVLLKNYSIQATVTGGAELSAKTRLEMEPQWSGERVVTLLLDSNLRVSAVRDSGGAALPFVQSQERRDRAQSYGDYIAVFFPEPLEHGKTYALEFEYSGKRVVRQMGTGVYFCQSFGWYPTRQNFAQRSNFELHFRSPKQFVLVATGTKTSEDFEGGTVATSWKSEKPIAVAGFAYGDVKIEKAAVGAVEVEVYANKNADDQMQNIARNARGAAVGELTPASMAGQIAQEMGNAIRLFEVYFGPYPYKKLSVSTIPFSYGQGWPSLIFLSALSFLDSTQRNAFRMDARAHRDLTDFFRAHETSHQWWGHKVAWKSYHDQWLSEGFAEFAGNLYVQKRMNNKEYLDRLSQSRKNLLLKDQNGHTFDSVGPIWMGLRLASSQSPSAYARLVYQKGGFVLHMLRMMLINPQERDPEARFKNMMRDFTATHDNGSASTEDFKAIAEKYMIPDMNLDANGRLDWFFNQYVYGTGIPSYEMQYTVTDAGGGKWKLAGTVTQSGVPRGWKDVLPLYIEFNKNLFRVGTINVMEPVVKFEETLTFRPERVALCVNEDTLGIIKQ